MRTRFNVLKWALFTPMVPALIAWVIPQVMVREKHAADGLGRVIGGLLIALGSGGLSVVRHTIRPPRGNPGARVSGQRGVIGGPYRINRPMHTSVLAVVLGTRCCTGASGLAIYGAAARGVRSSFCHALRGSPF